MFDIGCRAVRSLIDKLHHKSPGTSSQRSPTSKTALRFESLEERLLLFADSGYSWGDTDVSFSFVPDGASVEGYTNTLFEEMNANAETSVWQREIARALQTWANVSQLNFSLVADDGSPSGSSGSFGDVRFASHPLDGYLAYAYYPAGSSLGGDVFYNSDYTFRVGASYDIYSVTLHETGHSLGLDHSNVDGAVMGPYYQGVVSGLTADDIAGIQSIYGARQDDAFDAASRNDSLAAASSISADASGLVDFRADLTSMADIDFYRLVAPVDGDGTMSITLAAQSLLSTNLMVYDSAGNLLASDNAGAAFGTSSTLDLTGLTPGQEYFIVVDGGTTDEFGMGAYQLTVQLGGATGGTSGGNTGGNTGGDPGLAPDRFEVNDSFAAATDLGKFNSRTETGLTLHSDSDVDYYQFTARKGGTFQVTAASGSSVAVYDANHNMLATSSSGSVSVSLASGQTAYAVVQGLTSGYDLVIEKAGGGGGGGGGGKGGGKGGGPKGKLEVAPALAASPLDLGGVDHAGQEHGKAPAADGLPPAASGPAAGLAFDGPAGSVVPWADPALDLNRPWRDEETPPGLQKAADRLAALDAEFALLDWIRGGFGNAG